MRSVPRRHGAALRAVHAEPATLRRRLLVGALLPAVLLVPALAACSSSDAPDGTRAAPVPSATAAAAGRLPAVQNATDLAREPLSAAGKGAAPAKLVTADLVTGHGALASASSTVTIQYSGALWRNGKVFDSTWGGGQPATFPLAQTIAGFGQGIDGMRVGGRRQIVIPPALGYGPVGGQPPTILADDTLVFVVDLLGVAGSTGQGSATQP